MHDGKVMFVVESRCIKLLPKVAGDLLSILLIIYLFSILAERAVALREMVDIC